MQLNANPLSRLRPLQISYSSRRGGAAAAAWRLHSGLLAEGVESGMAVLETLGMGNAEGVQGPMGWSERLAHRFRKNVEIHGPRWRFPAVSGPFSPSWLGGRMRRQIDAFQPDVIHLHWINNGTLSVEAIASWEVPVVWTLHDMWPLTGGCHYSGGCLRYAAWCGQCPILGSRQENDVSSQLIKRKSAAWENLNLHLVAPSEWMAACARRSRLFQNRPIEVIPYGVDTEIFSPKEVQRARNDLKLDPQKTYLLFGAVNATTDVRKGFVVLTHALRRLKEMNPSIKDLNLLVVGASSNELPQDLPFPVTALGHISSETTMTTAYAAANLFVAPSLEDNLPNTVLESLACGTPVVAFKIGGMADMIQDCQNGRLAEPGDAGSLAGCIHALLADPTGMNEFGSKARQTVLEKFTVRHQARACSTLYEKILQGRCK